VLNKLALPNYIFYVIIIFSKGGVRLSKKLNNMIEEILASVGLESLKASEPKNVLKKIS